MTAHSPATSAPDWTATAGSTMWQNSAPRLDAGQLTADGKIDGAAPFATTATAHIASQLAEQPLEVAIQADGPLATLPLRAQPAAACRQQADITLTPFAATPFTCARVALSGLDPADWVTGAPCAPRSIDLDAQPHDDGLRGAFEIRATASRKGSTVSACRSACCAAGWPATKPACNSARSTPASGQRSARTIASVAMAAGRTAS